MSSDLPQRLEAARNEVARLERRLMAATCDEMGCDMRFIGGRNCGCEFPDGSEGQCSVSVMQCSRCGDCDYGDGAEANEQRARCAAERTDNLWHDRSIAA